MPDDLLRDFLAKETASVESRIRDVQRNLTDLESKFNLIQELLRNLDVTDENARQFNLEIDELGPASPFTLVDQVCDAVIKLTGNDPNIKVNTAEIVKFLERNGSSRGKNFYESVQVTLTRCVRQGRISSTLDSSKRRVYYPVSS